MKTPATQMRPRQGLELEQSQWLMLCYAGGYLFAGAFAAMLGFAGIGKLTLGTVVFLLILSALLLAAALLCSVLGTLESDGEHRNRD